MNKPAEKDGIAEDIWYLYKHWKALLFAFWAFGCIGGAILFAALGFYQIAQVLGGLAILIAAPYIVMAAFHSITSLFD